MRRVSLCKAASLILTASLCQALWAQEGLEEIPEAAPPPPASIKDGQSIEDGQAVEGGSSLDEDESLEPDVTIVQRKDATIEEYRLNGRLYMVKVIPFVGKPYYLVDNDGDGLMEGRVSDLKRDPLVPQWVIFSW